MYTGASCSGTVFAARDKLTTSVCTFCKFCQHNWRNKGCFVLSFRSMHQTDTNLRPGVALFAVRGSVSIHNGIVKASVLINCAQLYLAIYAGVFVSKAESSHELTF